VNRTEQPQACGKASKAQRGAVDNDKEYLRPRLKLVFETLTVARIKAIYA